MSRRHDLQSADGVLESVSPFGRVQVVGIGAPTNAQSGFAPGCIYQNLTGTLGTLVYVNTGTKTSTTWIAII